METGYCRCPQDEATFYFGRKCQLKVDNLNIHTFKDTNYRKNLQLGRFERYFMEENYDKGDSSTDLIVKYLGGGKPSGFNPTRPLILIILNQAENESKQNFWRESNEPGSSQSQFLKSWPNGKEKLSLDVKKERLFLQIINLDSREAADTDSEKTRLSLTITSKID